LRAIHPYFVMPHPHQKRPLPRRLVIASLALLLAARAVRGELTPTPAGAPETPPYAQFQPLLDTGWTAPSSPTDKGVARTYEEDFSRDIKTGGIRINTLLTVGDRQVPLATGTIAWNPKTRQLHQDIFGPGHASSSTDGHWDGTALTLDGALTLGEEVQVPFREVMTLVSADVRTQEIYEQVGGDWVLSAAFRFTREQPAGAPGAVAAPLAVPYFEEATIVKSSRPRYPFKKQWGLTARTDIVIVQFVIEADGTVVQARGLSKIDPAFVENANDAVQDWVFKPARRNGTPVRTVRFVPIVFRRA
jgi:hypothetical protein